MGFDIGDRDASHVIYVVRQIIIGGGQLGSASLPVVFDQQGNWKCIACSQTCQIHVGNCRFISEWGH